MADTLVTINTVDDLAATPIDGVNVLIFDEFAAFVTSGLTGSMVPGQVEFLLPASPTGIPYSVWFYKAGVSFLPQAVWEIVVTEDPFVPLEMVGHEGLIGEVVTIAVSSSEVEPLEDVRIHIYSAVDLFLTEVRTGVSGAVDLILGAGTYILRLFKEGWTFLDGPTQTIEVLSPLPVGGTNEFDFFADAPEIPESTDPRMCLISGYFSDVSLHPLQRLRIRCMPQIICPDKNLSGFPGSGNPGVVLRNIILNEVVVETNTEGYVEILLPRASQYDVHIHGFENPGVPTYGQIFVPDSLSARVEDVFFPYVRDVIFEESSVTLAVEETAVVHPTAVGSNDQELFGTSSVESFLTFSSSDPLVASIISGAEGTLIIRGVSTGTATILVQRADSSFVPRVPDVPDLVVGVVNITVT